MNGLKQVKSLRDRLLLFRSGDYIAVNKPLGIETVAGKEPPRALRSLLEEMKLIKESCPIPIHSLRSDVSGVQLLSLNATAGLQARCMIREGQFWRCKFWAIVSGRIKGRNCEGVINVPMKNGKIVSEGDPSITHWKLLKYSSEERLSLLELEPRTIFPDQIHIHCESVLQCPIVTDHGLHVYKMKACLPDDIEVQAPVLNEFRNKMQSLGWL